MGKENSKKATTILKDFQQLEVFSLTQDLDEFSDLLYKISSLCLGFNISWGENDPGMSENEFYSLINNYYSQFQKVFPSNFSKISCNNQEYDYLVSRSFNFLVCNIRLVIILILYPIKY